MTTVGPGSITFSGINTVIACSMSSCYGTAPSAGTIRFIEQPAVRRTGDLVFECDGQSRRFRGCRIGNFQKLTDGANRRIVVAQVLDRRWRWQRAVISGLYNIKRARGGYQPKTEKTPRELATMLFESMGEKGADVSALPNESRPEINWDVANAANELALLCESLACRVVLGSDDRVRIVRLGTGKPLQDSPFAYALGESLETPDPPDKIKLIGGYILYQCRILLQAVGLDIGGVVRPIDALSYKPKGGWKNENPATLGGVLDKEIRQTDGSLVNQRQLAQASVYRMYQAKDIGHEITDELKDVERRQLILSNELAEKYVDELGIERRRAALCAGIWNTVTKPDAPKNSKDDQPVVIYSPNTLLTQNLGFSVDPERWLVTFGEPVYKNSDTTGEVEPAEIYLVCAVIVRDKDTLGPLRFEKEITLGKSGPNPVVEAIRRDDVVKRVVTKYRTSGEIEGTEVLDEENLNKRADYYLDAQKRIYLPATQQGLSQKGIHDIAVDGLVQQVTWSIDTSSGADTSASQGFEANRLIPDYEEWRRRQKVIAAATEGAA